ncbi:L,D-transpeptidase, partial [Aeromonas sp. CPF2-S1]|nr:L,D-transpeptidase [Aeromonas sp. CPF2-S1]
VPVGTRVQFVNQPVKTTVEPDGGRYMEVHEPLSRTEEEFNSTASVPLPMTPAITRFIAHAESDSNVVKQVLEQRTGMPTRLNP